MDELDFEDGDHAFLPTICECGSEATMEELMHCPSCGKEFCPVCSGRPHICPASPL